MIRLFFLSMVVLLSAGCSRVQYVPVESVRLDSIHVYRNVSSSMTIRDSIYIDKTRDTVRVAQYKYVGVRLERTDTLYVARADSVRIPYPVEKRLTKWQSVKADYGGWAMGILFALVLIAAGRTARKLKR